jgi:chorismate dehydratase
LYKISAVSYLNTKPFIYGINHSPVKEMCEVELDTPANCAQKLIDGKVDIGLIPVAVIPQLKESHIITNYCIGAKGAVSSVMLYSEVPLNEIENVLLDYQSRTSVALTRVLAKFFWKISPNWKPAKEGFENTIGDKTAGIVIGDRTFELKDKFAYSYDLAEEWTKFTGFPFVFACWVANKVPDKEFISALNNGLKIGVEKINEIASKLQGQYGKLDVKDYLTKKLSFDLDEDKKKALKLFLNYLKEI